MACFVSVLFDRDSAYGVGPDGSIELPLHAVGVHELVTQTGFKRALMRGVLERIAEILHAERAPEQATAAEAAARRATQRLGDVESEVAQIESRLDEKSSALSSVSSELEEQEHALTKVEAARERALRDAEMADSRRDEADHAAQEATARADEETERTSEAVRACTAAEQRLAATTNKLCLLYTSPSPRDQRGSRMPSSA